jgi:Cu(I)/Ag(I) efflux system periplasmic protein CusF
MRLTHTIISAIVVLSVASAACAQEALKGEVAKVDEASGSISIKLSGTVGSSDTTTPTAFKVQDGLIFNAVKPGDKVSFTAERVRGELTVKQLKKE